MDAERKLLSVISQSRRLCLRASELLMADELSNSIYIKLATKMYECAKSGTPVDEALILNEFSGDTEAENIAATVFFNNEEYTDSDKTLYDLIYTIKMNKLETNIKVAVDPSEISALIKEKTLLMQERKDWQSNI